MVRAMTRWFRHRWRHRGRAVIASVIGPETRRSCRRSPCRHGSGCHVLVRPRTRGSSIRFRSTRGTRQAPLDPGCGRERKSGTPLALAATAVVSVAHQLPATGAVRGVDGRRPPQHRDRGRATRLDRPVMPMSGRRDVAARQALRTDPHSAEQLHHPAGRHPNIA